MMHCTYYTKITSTWRAREAVWPSQTPAHFLTEKLRSYRKGATGGYHKNTSSLGMSDQVKVEIWSSRGGW